MANRSWKNSHVLEMGVIKLYGSFVVGASGAIASQSCKGFKLTKTASEVGRYTVALEDKYTALLAASVALEGAADVAYAGAGITTFIRNVAVAAASPKLELQVSSAIATPADTEPVTGTKVYIELTLKNSSGF